MPATKENSVPNTILDEDKKGQELADKLASCSWNKEPINEKDMLERKKTCSDILQAIGHTPLVELKRIPKAEGVKCRMLAKCEFENPGGSVKDRIALRMILDAEEKGILKPGYTVIEPTSGNTGIGLALTCAVRGYKCIIVMPDKMSNERVITLRALGAQVVRAPSDIPPFDPEGFFGVAFGLQKSTPNSVILNQFMNPDNPLAHYDTTGPEILWQCDKKIDMFVAGTGTGGTVTGIGRRIKEIVPDCKIIAADPIGSKLARPERLNETDVTFFEMEGIGYIFVPEVLDRTVVDEWIKVGDKESFVMARRLNLEEGLLCGGSSGSAMCAAIKAAKNLREDQTCVVLLADGIRNYMTKFVTDNWMEARDYTESVNTHGAWWWDHKVTELKLEVPKTFTTATTCEEALNFMKANDLEGIPILKDDGIIFGAVTYSTLTSQVVNQNMQPSDPVKKAVYKTCIKVQKDATLGKIGRVLETEPLVFVLSPEDKLVGVITNKILLNFIVKNSTQNENKRRH